MSRSWPLFVITLALSLSLTFAAPPPKQSFTLDNGRVRATIELAGGRLAGERLETVAAWAGAFGPGALLTTDGGFALEVVWTDWRPPGKANNADNFIRLTAADFVLVENRRSGGPNGEELTLTFKGPEGFGVELHYQMPRDSNLVRRRLVAFDEKGRDHFLHALYPLDAEVKGPVEEVTSGGFGQPVAIGLGGGGAFAGLEWPTAENELLSNDRGKRLRCGEVIGELIPKSGISGQTAVIGLTPDARVKYWFGRYLETIRVGRLRPYTLYNSWYDLRSTEYPRVQPDEVMNEENIRRIIRLLRQNMIEKYGMTLDAFVLDDGWDVYESDWMLRPVQFPNGLAPLVDELKATRTRLGIWYGPIGGYSFRKKRVAWMREHGYETVGDQLWVGGPKYSELLARRTAAMTRAGVGYFKWDGFQFLASNPGLGTPPGIYSRRAALNRVIELAEGVRKLDPDMFLNLTSGTWLSPWWLRFADQIWMDGEDYGSADVPSISTRDSSITYRDLVLYEDFRLKGLWFPIANLMTHGILKGRIDVAEIGKGEPLSKFADEVAFYLARGVTMYELYISPDLLSEGEWRVLADSLKWARERFPVLSQGEMVGGDPNRREPYGYVHYRDAEGIVAVRNPDIHNQTLRLLLDPAHGLDPKAENLAFERIYPTRWVSPRIYRAGDTVELSLTGYEAAIYQLRPLSQIKEPLVADVVFEELGGEGALRRLAVLEIGADPKVLDYKHLLSITRGGRLFDPARLAAEKRPLPPLAEGNVVVPPIRPGAPVMALESRFRLRANARHGRVGLLLKPDAPHQGKADPEVKLLLDGQPAKPDTVDAKGIWAWYTLPVTPGAHRLELQLAPGKDAAEWAGQAAVWVLADEQLEGVELVLEADALLPQRPLPATGREPRTLPRTVALGAVTVSAKK